VVIYICRAGRSNAALRGLRERCTAKVTAHTQQRTFGWGERGWKRKQTGLLRVVLCGVVRSGGEGGEKRLVGCEVGLIGKERERGTQTRTPTVSAAVTKSTTEVSRA
jgi:hypothetical protein